MDMLSVLRDSGGLEAMASQLGVSPSVAASGAEVLLPAILGGFKNRTRAAGGGEAGIGDLIGMLGGLGGGGLLRNVLGPQPTDVSRGNEVLGQIFGSKEVSRSVAGHASRQSGISPELLKRMLPILAMLVGGYLSSHASGAQAAAPAAPASSGGGILGNILGSVLGGGQAQAGPGLGGIGSMLDLDGDGNPLDDIIGMAGKLRALMALDLVLSLLMLTAFALVAGAVVLWRRGIRKKAGLMLLLAGIILVNVLVWTVPDSSGKAPVDRVAEVQG